MKFTGSDVRQIRIENKLSRAKLASILNVSPVTIEKWEQNKDKLIRSKYYPTLNSIVGGSAAGIGAGILGATAVLGPTALIGAAALGAAAMIKDEDLIKMGELIEKLKILSPEERTQYFQLLKKMNS